MTEKTKKLPAKAWHVPAALLAVLLTVVLWATQLGLVGLQVMTSRGLHERVVLDRSIVDAQMARIAERVVPVAQEYGFDPAPVTAAITREQVEALDRQVVAWWTGLVSAGTLEDPVTFHADLQDVLRADAGFLNSQEPVAVNGAIESIEVTLDDEVRKTCVLFRDELVRTAVRKAEGMVNLPQATEILHQLPALGGAAALLLAGLIALIMSRKIQLAGRYIGGALSGCGLLMLLTLGLIKALNLSATIGEASQALLAQFTRLSRLMTLEVLGGAALLMILGGLAMGWADRARRKTA